MRRSILARVLTPLAVALFLATLATALVIVWTANERVWYIDTGGVNATLDMSLTAAARWIATGVLGALIALGIAALALSLRAPRRVSDAAPSGMPVTGKTFTYVARPPAAVAVEDRTAPPGAYHSTIVGDTEVRRAEESLPPTVVMRRDVVAALTSPDATGVGMVEHGATEQGVTEHSATGDVSPESVPDSTERPPTPTPGEAVPDDRTRIVFRRRAADRREAGRATADRGE